MSIENLLLICCLPVSNMSTVEEYENASKMERLSETVYSAGVTTATARRQTAEDVDNSLSYFAIFQDRMIPSRKYHIQTFQTLTTSQCARLCYNTLLTDGLTKQSTDNQDPKCQSFEMITTGGRPICALSNVSAGSTISGGYSSLVRSPGTSYYEAPRDHLSLFSRAPGVVFRNDSKYTRLVNNTDADGCAHTCIMTSQLECNSFAYNQGNKVCALSRDVVESSDDIEMVENYDTFQYYGDWPCNVTLPWNYSPRVIASPDYPYIPRNSSTCFFHILAPQSRRVVITIRTLIIDTTDCSDRSSGLFVYDGESEQSKLLLSVCHHRPELVTSSYKSSGRSLLIKMSSTLVPVVAKITFTFVDHDACDGHGCQNGGSCVPHTQTYTCACVRGFSGERCETNINDCLSNPCLFGECVDKIDGYECKCMLHVIGKRCELYMGECVNKPCVNGTCTPLVSGYRCSCADGFTGKNCEYEINECFSNPCMRGHCIDLVNSYKCVCGNGFIGRNCEVQANSTTCQDYECKYGTCAVNESGSFCQCFPGYSGTKCEINLNECSMSPCGSRGRCIDHSNGYHCECLQGYVGEHCDISLADSCHSNNCNHGYCSVTSPDGSYRCICENNYTGIHCDTIITPCDSTPCLHGTCNNRGTEFICNCSDGYEGKRCDVKMNDCKDVLCVNGKCEFYNSIHVCICNPGWTGNSCDVQVTPCTIARCNNGTCINTSEGFVCHCDTKHTGQYCEKEINPCVKSPCGDHGTCIPVADSFKCHCSERRTGLLCENIVNACESSPCIHGTCILHADTYLCNCDASFTGINCQIEVVTTTNPTLSRSIPSVETFNSTVDNDPCKRFYCKHGTCISIQRGVFCNCFSQYTGINCDLPIKLNISNTSITTELLTTNNSRRSDPCFSSPCVNGTCNVVDSKPVCVCYGPYTGLTCEVVIQTDLTSIVPRHDNEPKACSNKTCIHGNCITHNNITSCVCDNNYTGDQCQTELKIKFDQTIIYLVQNKHAPGKGVTYTDTKDGEKSDIVIKCNKTSCIHGKCLYYGKAEKCDCYKGFTGESCNISLKSVTTAPHDNTSNDTNVMEYVVIAVLSVCLVLFVVACGILMFKKMRSGSVYITNPSDFEVSWKPYRKAIHKAIGNWCPGQDSSGISVSSDDSRHGNKYDDVDVTINEQRQIGYPNETRTYQNKQRQIGYPNERRTYQNQDTTRISTVKPITTLENTTNQTHQNNCNHLPHRPRQIITRLLDKDYRRPSHIQMVDGVEKGKSEA